MLSFTPLYIRSIEHCTGISWSLFLNISEFTFGLVTVFKLNTFTYNSLSFLSERSSWISKGTIFYRWTTCMLDEISESTMVSYSVRSNILFINCTCSWLDKHNQCKRKWLIPGITKLSIGITCIYPYSSKLRLKKSQFNRIASEKNWKDMHDI